MIQKYEAQVALESIHYPDELIEVILKYQFKRPAARLLRAYQYLGNSPMVYALEAVLERMGTRVKEENPFITPEPLIKLSRHKSPYYARILTLWNSMREDVIKNFPQPVPHTSNWEKQMEDLYVQDAYNSLSIEGYEVDENLIERVKKGEWNPLTNQGDQQTRSALAARGYFEAHLEVKKTLRDILNGKNPGDAIADDLSKWYYALFNPNVRAGILEQKDLFGYRKGPVYIKNARHVPPERSDFGCDGCLVFMLI